MKIENLIREDDERALEIVGLNYNHITKGIVWDYITASRKSNHTRFIAMKEGDELLGFGGYGQGWIDSKVYEIFCINVHPQYQRQGIGKAMIEYMLEKIEDDKDAKLILLTSSSPSYYLKFGFRVLCQKNEKSYLMGKNIHQDFEPERKETPEEIISREMDYGGRF